jgi:hypothetical protein
MVTDGPYAESKEAIAGFIVIQSGSLEEAAEIAKRAPLSGLRPDYRIKGHCFRGSGASDRTATAGKSAIPNQPGTLD